MTADGFHVELTLRNYRCFGPEPVTLAIRDGFTGLVGLNNGGKSTLLRVLYELRPLFSEAYVSDALTGTWQARWFEPQYAAAGERIWRARTDTPVEIGLRVHSGGDANAGLSGRVDYQFELDRTGPIAARMLLDGAPLSPQDVPRDISKHLAATFHVLRNTMYVGPFRNALSPGGGQYYDLVTGQAFITQFRAYKTGDPEQGEAVLALQQELARIFGFEHLDINPSEDGQTLQVFVDGRSFRLSELGAGISHFIIVLVNILVRKPSLLLIDEPELNLHATLQLDFLTTLGQQVDVGVLFATHSLGLARTAAEHVLIVNQKANPGQRQVQPYEGSSGLAALAGQLGFDSRPEVGYDRVLLVEGRSEVRAVMQLLRLYGKEHRVALVPLGGGEFFGAEIEVELRELMRLGAVYYLIDSERSAENAKSSKKHEAFTSACGQLGIPGLMLERRAFENYLPQRALDRAFGSGAVRALGPYEAPSAGSGWRKTHNWRVAAQMVREDLNGTDLGAFLEKL